MNRHSPEKAQPLLDSVLTELGETYERIGATGYCWGGKFSLLLASQQKVVAYVVAHPGGTVIEDVHDITAPGLFLCAEKDPMFPEKLSSVVKAKLQEIGAPHEFVHFKGTEHGFAVRGDPNNAVIAKATDDATKLTGEWNIKNNTMAANNNNEAEVPKIGDCCFQGHIWTGTPTGSEIKLKSGMNAYLAETKGSTRVVLFIH
eukprot:jgi/Hompol1/3160/HPOL_006390-RA